MVHKEPCLEQDDGHRSSADDPSDDDLLLSAAGGDRRAFQRLMQRHARPTVALAQRIVGNAADADEIVQETFLKVWTMASRWEPDGAAKFSTWLYRVVLNASLDRLRRVPFAPLEEAGDVPDPSPGGLEQTLAGQRRRILSQAMNDLPMRQREALTLYYFGEVSGPQAAQILDLSLSACEALLTRGKRSLKKALVSRGVTHLADIA